MALHDAAHKIIEHCVQGRLAAGQKFKGNIQDALWCEVDWNSSAYEASRQIDAVFKKYELGGIVTPWGIAVRP